VRAVWVAADRWLDMQAAGDEGCTTRGVSISSRLLGAINAPVRRCDGSRGQGMYRWDSDPICGTPTYMPVRARSVARHLPRLDQFVLRRHGPAVIRYMPDFGTR